MNSVLDACLRSWPWNPWLLGGLALTAIVYARGWRISRRRDPERFPVGGLIAFFSGLATIFLALASPIEPFSYFFLQVHMAQHLLLMMVAPPLVWLGSPLIPILRGLPKPIRVVWIAPLFRSRAVRRSFEFATHPLAAWTLYVGVTWVWHVPALYDLALTSESWHYFQHACFLIAALVFWYPVVRPYPARPSWSKWWLIPYLLLADVQNTVLSALLTFSNRVLYTHYSEVPRLVNLTALEDQANAGVLMWVPGSIAFLVPLFWIGLQLMFAATDRSPRRISLPVLSNAPPRADVLHVPFVGRFLKWRHARLALQIPLLFLAGVIAFDGFFGPQAGPMNLAGVVPWIHWRGLLILGLLTIGNVFCMACPLTLPRTLARRWRPAIWNWPRPLRNKWTAVALLLAFFWAYEAFSLWDNPWWTAAILVAYFVAAFGVDLLFRDAAFCKFVCPIGQFNFVQSLISPIEIAVRDPAICDRCETKDCIRGRDGIPGCELRLFQPRKSSNMDCTFCLDCVHACPHDNIGLLASTPGSELWHDRARSGLGRFSRRFDIASLIAVLSFGAFVNAALMTGPVLRWHDALAVWLTPHGSTTLLTLAGFVIAPAILIGIAAMASHGCHGLIATATRYAYCLVPLGFSMWLTHYSFHFLTTFAAVVPTTQRFVADLGWPVLGSPLWSCSCCIPPADWLIRLEIVFLDIGLLVSLYAALRIAEERDGRGWTAIRRFAPWGVLLIALFATGIWIVFQPMEMRGSLMLTE